MKTGTHTPGPWATAPAFPDQVYSVPEFERAQREEPDANPYDESLIVETAGHEANARLIAAAPELLAAVVVLLPHAEKLMEASGAIDGLVDSRLNLDCELEQAKKAIAKAKGEQT
jgi:hypothetical protein